LITDSDVRKWELSIITGRYFIRLFNLNMYYHNQRRYFVSYQRLLPTDWLETAKWATKESAYIRVWKVQAISMVTANCWFITNDTIKTLTSWSRGYHSCFVFGRSQVQIRVLSRFWQMLG
jgi:hypothetical protein